MSQETELKRPEIKDLYNAVAKLVIDAFLLPRRFHGDAVVTCTLKQVDTYDAAEDVLARGLEKQNIPADIARYSAFQYVSKLVEALSKSPLDAIGRAPPKPPGPGLEWVRIG